MFEIIAPAGDIESMAAAVKAGADAVYFGFSTMNARLRARNFDDPAALKAVSYLRDHGIKSYITLNTVVRENELGELERKLRLLSSCSPDAIIFQDLAVAQLTKRILPGVELHASTQCGIWDLDGLEIMKELGASRAVVARELTKEDLNKLAARSPIELEIFIFGSMCYCASGYCYASLQETSRSANRGECAQVCRKMHAGSYPFSMKDLDLCAQIPTLLSMGIRAFKIEGRMKGADYVHEVVRAVKHIKQNEASLSSVNQAQSILASVMTRQRGQGYFFGTGKGLITEESASVHKRAGTVSGVSGSKIFLRLEVGMTMPGPGSRIKIGKNGAIVTASSHNAITLTRPIQAAFGAPVFLSGNKGSIKGISGIVKEIEKTSCKPPVKITVSLTEDRYEKPSGSGCRMDIKVINKGSGIVVFEKAYRFTVQTSLSSSGITKELLAQKLASPRYFIYGISVDKNLIVVRHRDLKDIKHDIEAAALASCDSAMVHKPLWASYPEFCYTKASGMEIMPEPGHPAAPIPAGTVAVIANNFGHIAAARKAMVKDIAAGPFIPVLNRIYADALKNLGVSAFIKPYEAIGGTGAPRFLTRKTLNRP